MAATEITFSFIIHKLYNFLNNTKKIKTKVEYDLFAYQILAWLDKQWKSYEGFKFLNFGKITENWYFYNNV